MKNQAAKAQRKGKSISHRVHRAHREVQEYLTQSPQSPQRGAGIFEPCPAWLRGPSRANPHPAAAGIEYNGETGELSVDWERAEELICSLGKNKGALADVCIVSIDWRERIR